MAVPKTWKISVFAAFHPETPAMQACLLVLACLVKFCADTAILTRLGVVMIDPPSLVY